MVVYKGIQLTNHQEHINMELIDKIEELRESIQNLININRHINDELFDERHKYHKEKP